MIGVAVLYPKTETSHFDTEYYHAKHMKLVRELWEPMGLRGARVMHGQTGPDGKPPLYAVMTLLEFDSVDAFGKAASTHGGPIMGDIANFTNVQPIIQINEIMS